MVALKYLPEEYDAKGQLRLPFLFWLILLLQARTWLLLVMAGASRQQGNDLLALFYPDRQSFWLGLALGIPAAIGLLLTGYRQRWPRLWQSWRHVLSASLLISLLWQGFSLLQGAFPDSPLPLLLTLFDLLALFWLQTQHRLRDCFLPEHQHIE
ncbi:Protein of unknown function [Candidatus Pantoea symbiotica]|jgi:hypothetical protein|uniref:DUF2919 domain-containing protein n=1 Tax=Candidatus Pantoea symbiotica TaxID=1884370 RepID=A0A1I3WF38_9GAMM|nr:MULTISPECIES: DUF2919 domain-containing protein [Pantoea]KAJ9432279.1 DUF2919 domain-containing protein [Pantoea sp. YR343]SFK06010.1 Protein of unknown function [Pantoea symbiotica]SFU72267.1 Protein of unknown function [Pantoea sp. YR525]